MVDFAKMLAASMRPRGQTPRMRVYCHSQYSSQHKASMRPRGQTPRMLDRGYA